MKFMQETAVWLSLVIWCSRANKKFFTKSPSVYKTHCMTHDIRALTREWFELVWNQRDESAIARIASPQIISHGLGEDRAPAQGFDLFLQFRRSILSAFPDIRMTVADVLVEGDKSAVRLSFTGTHTGNGIGIPPTGRRFTASAIIIIRWKDGKAVEAWNEFDAAAMMQQLQAPAAKLRP